LQRLIVREMHHRTQNLFAMFQAIASSTIDENKTTAEVKYVLEGRLQALAAAYTIPAYEGSEGVSLTKILDREVAAFSQRVNVSGCDIAIAPQAAQQFALIVHELATNALKYGALSVADGRISIEGSRKRLDGGGVFSFLWKESGGPKVPAPARKGF